MREASRFFVADFLPRQVPDLFTLSCSREPKSAMCGVGLRCYHFSKSFRFRLNLIFVEEDSSEAAYIEVFRVCSDSHRGVGIFCLPQESGTGDTPAAATATASRADCDSGRESRGD
jgi:hypothetical protein